jgi:hypothetical protein
MKLPGLTAILATLLLQSFTAHGPLPPAPHVGDTYEITLTRDSEQRGDGSSGSSHDQDTIREQVLGIRPDGLQLLYDLPDAATAEDRARAWEFPARILLPPSGPAQLLNASELGARLDHWLRAGGLSRASCGHWVFTWNAFHIECDPQSVLKTVQSLNLRSVDLREGAVYQDAESSNSARLVRTVKPEGAVFTVELPIDPDSVHHARAESDVVVGEIMKKPVSFDDALRARAKESVSGTISIAFDTDPQGNVHRRTKVTKLEVTKPDGRSETETVTETLERRLIPARH